MILMYHKVDVTASTLWWVTPADLDRQLAALGSRQLVHLDDYVSPATQAVITFDDAYENVARHAVPVLLEHRAPFEVFVVGDRIGEWNDFDPGEPPTRHMGIEHLDEVVGSGGRLQWHSRSHPHLPDLTDEQLEAEMTVPGELRDRYPAPHFRWFSYPGGAHDARAVSCARRRFAGAVSVLQGEPDDRWQLNRVTADRDTALGVLGPEQLHALVMSV